MSHEYAGMKTAAEEKNEERKATAAKRNKAELRAVNQCERSSHRILHSR
jgi:hypothetical protein